MRDRRDPYQRQTALERDIARAQADYSRLRGAYLGIATHEPDHEVALALIGSDMDRAHARLQALIGLPQLPFTHDPTKVLRREAQRHTRKDS